MRRGGGPGLASALRLEDLVAKVGNFTLGPINLELGRGEVALIFGPNGAGKTTLLKTILGFYRPVKGKVVINGIDSTYVPINRRNIGYVPQSLALFDNMSVRDNVEFGLKARGVPKSERERLVKEMAERLRISDLLDRRVTELSGGQMQRVAIARAVIARPALLLLDEPASNLDPTSVEELIDTIRYVTKEFGITTIIVSHSISRLLRVASRLLFMSGGRLVDLGDVETAVRSPVKAEAAVYLGYDNIIPCDAIDPQPCDNGKALAARYNFVLIGDTECDGIPLDGTVEQLYVGLDGVRRAVARVGNIRVMGIAGNHVKLGETKICIRREGLAVVDL
ncbi:ABC transporter ATP-binding protein [Acidilobus sp.]|uniref:ABC transporter ATP-binding protein n=1 Tax=Acidilobus sp. TaxID=1872109 RepID=UPI003D073A33